MRGGGAVHKRGAPWREHLELPGVAAAAAVAQPPHGAAGAELWAHLPYGEGHLPLASQPGAFLPPRNIRRSATDQGISSAEQAGLCLAGSYGKPGSWSGVSFLPCCATHVNIYKRRPAG